VIPFALAQRTITKQNAIADPLLLGSPPVATLPDSNCPATWSVTGSLNTARFAHRDLAAQRQGSGCRRVHPGRQQ